MQGDADSGLPTKDQREFELRKDTAARWWEEYQKNLEYSKDFGLVVIRSVVLINGGAIVALLTVISNLAKNDSNAAKLLPNLRDAMLAFALGLICGVAASAFGYLSYITVALGLPWPNEIQKFVSKGGSIGWKEDPPMTKVWMALTALSALMSIVGFGMGAYLAVRGLSGPVKP